MFQFIKNLFKKEEQLNIAGCFDEVDERTFGAEVIAGQVVESDLTDKNFKTVDFKNLIYQAWTDFCVGCSASYSKEATEGKQMSWAGAYALACKLIGYIPDFGMSILAMMKARVQFGIPEESVYPSDINKTKSQLADYTKLSPAVIANAYQHRDKSYFQINPPAGWSKFDAFRGFLNKFKDQKVVINTGADSHAISLCKQKLINGEMRLGGPDSYGTNELNYRLGISVKGWRYFTKYEVAQFYNGYIGFDMDRTLAELLNEYNHKSVKIAGDNTCWYIDGGKKRNLGNEGIAWAHGTLLFYPDYVFEIKKEELDLIPVGEPMKYKEGPMYPVVQRILEKASKMDRAGIIKLLEDLNR